MVQREQEILHPKGQQDTIAGKWEQSAKNVEHNKGQEVQNTERTRSKEVQNKKATQKGRRKSDTRAARQESGRRKGQKGTVYHKG